MPSHSSGSSDSDTYREIRGGNGSRKRRRLSRDDDDSSIGDVSSSSRDASPEPQRLPVPTLSRIAAKKKGTVQPDAFKSTRATVSTSSASFADLGVAPWLVMSLSAMAIKRPTNIQKGCIPEILKGRDCIGGSRTGSGKTVAFAVPILQKWAEDPVGIFAVILTPTRLVSPCFSFLYIYCV